MNRLTFPSRPLIFSIFLLLLYLQPTTAPAQPLPKINVVLVTPSDVAPPKDAVKRLTEVADYSEAFLVNWMTRWKYEPKRKEIFDRTDDGNLQVLFLKGNQTLKSGTYNKPGFAPEVWNRINAQHKLGRHKHMWWIWVYLGDPPLRFQGFVGGGNAKDGGTSYVNYLNAPGAIKTTDAIGGPFLKEFALKGTIHELGHSFGLPHIGPLKADDLGMPLMGANIPNFLRVTKSKEQRGYVSPAAAAMLWKHPIFSGTTKDRNLIPAVKIENLELSPGRGRNYVVSGQLTSNAAAHSVVLFDSVPKVHEKYWQKSYVSRIDPKDYFRITVTEPSPKPGTLKLIFCFNNGAVTGDGTKLGLNSSHNRDYGLIRGKVQLLPP